MNPPLDNSDIKILADEISELKAEFDTIILAHNYQRPEIYTVADKIGDSLELSVTAANSGKKIIVFCGVDFMAESAKILSPNSQVLLPVQGARCPMAHFITSDDILNLKSRFPSAEVVSYVNTTAEIKALSDICCTSANAKEIVESCESEEVIFLPDQNLAAYVQRFTSKKIIPGNGNCYVHEEITPKSVQIQKESNPDSLFIAHPECRPDVIDMADAVLSTSGMIRYCRESKASSFIVGTESGMINRLIREIPDKVFYPLGGICSPMKLITLESVKRSLLERKYEVNLTPDIIRKARLPLERMIQRTGSVKQGVKR